MSRNTAELVTAADVAWSSGDKFNGFILLLVVPPQTRTSVYLKDSQRIRVPLDIKIPVLEGEVSTKQKIWQTTELEPPNCQYCALWYDDTLAQVASGPSLFTVTSASHTITPPTLTSPTADVSCPDPDVALTDSAVVGINLAAEINVETASGSGSSVTITESPSKIIGLYLNGQRLVQGVDYTVSGTTITFTFITVNANEVLVVYV